MSYSRWITSRWYTYWSDSSAKDKENQIFRIEDINTPLEFTYHELSNKIEDCLAKVNRLNDNVTDDELIELYAYMLRFVRDVDNEFKEKVNEQTY